MTSKPTKVTKGKREFDYSDVRLVLGNKSYLGNERVYAHLINDSHIELYCDKWREELKTPEWVAYYIFHEHLHQVLNTIQIEDGIHKMIKDPHGTCDPHFPFFAGLDEILGITMSKTHPNWYLSESGIQSTIKHFEELRTSQTKGNDGK